MLEIDNVGEFLHMAKYLYSRTNSEGTDEFLDSLLRKKNNS